MIELRLFGGFALHASDQRPAESLIRRPKRAALLAYLAVARSQELHRRDKLLALFWPELDETHARAALSQALHVLRSTLGAGAIITAGDEAVQLSTNEVWCDAQAFEALLDASRSDAALALYRGDLLDGFFVDGVPEFERWLDRERDRFRARASEGAWTLAERAADASDQAEAERWARRAMDLAGFDEIAVRRFMSFLSRLGDRASAVRAYEAFAWHLEQEYDLKPSPETLALVAAIRRETGGSASVSRMAPAPTAGQKGSSELSASPPDATNGTPDRLGSTSSMPALRPSRWQRWLATTIGATALILMLGEGWNVRTHDATRLIVLPFRNLGAPDDGYLADGITDEITARLMIVKGLDVVGARAAARYAKNAASPPVIANEMDIDYLLEGTVSRETSNGVGRIRVRPRLVSARDDKEVWTVVLQEDLAHTPDLFTLLGGIAQRVVDELHVATDATARRGIASVPTSSQQAYDAYLRGRDFKRRTWSEINTRVAVQMFERAVERDSGFAMAWAWLSFAHTDADWLNGLGAAHLDSARLAGERALQLSPDLADAHVAMGHYFYVCCADYERAAWHMALGAAARPGDPWITMLTGNVHKRLGRWQEAQHYYERAAAADPKWLAPLTNLAQLQLWTRQYDEAELTLARAVSLNPQETFLHSFRTWIPLLRRGDTSAARQALQEAENVSDGYSKMRLPFYLALLRHDYAGALTMRPPVQNADGNAGQLDEGLPSDAIRKGLAVLLLGDAPAARIHFMEARKDLEERLRRTPASSRRSQIWLRASISLACAGLGDHATTRQYARQALEMDPVATDALDGPLVLQNIALAYTLVGEKSRALDLLERLVSIPARFSPALLRVDPLWTPLRGEPRYERLVQTGQVAGR